MASRCVLGLFAKQPVPGQVKTRLAAATSPEWAAEVAAGFLRDTIERLATIDAQRVVVFAPADAEPYFAALVRGRFALVPQSVGDLGQRMERFLDDQLRSGAERVVLVGSDSPTMPVEFVERAFADLHQADVVLGPATDGGYYLLGCARRVPPIFDGVAWSTSRVLSDTIARLSTTDCRLTLLPPWYDVDTLDDWWMMQGHLAALRRSGAIPQSHTGFREAPTR